MRPHRGVLASILLDAFVLCAMLWLAFALRFEGAIPSDYYVRSWLRAALILAIWLPTYAAFGLYRSLWRYSSLSDFFRLLAAATAASIVHAAAVFSLRLFVQPRSIIILFWLLSFLAAGMLRAAYRLHSDWPWPLHGKNGRTLIFGAGDAGVMIAREMRSAGLRRDHHPIGFVDDDAAKRGRSINGLPVFGGRREIPALVKEHRIEEIIIAIPSAPRTAIREIVEICRPTAAKLRILPGLYELIDGRVTIASLREIRIEDLLGRDPVQVNLDEIAGYLRGKRVLVTGAGGSIGAEICRQVLRFDPSALIMLGRGENSIYDIEMELINTDDRPRADLVPLVGDVRDAALVRDLFDKHRPQVVFHAAAHKHVPLMERCPLEAVKNNVFGTYNVAGASREFGAERFVLISTDKAVRPINILGASKRAAELIIQRFGADGSPTKFVAVRFGNVLGSRGSVVPRFSRQIAAGGPVTVTHPEMKRYFMTIPEAVELVVQAGAMGRGGEVFVLDMGEPVRIIDLAENMIRLSGLNPGTDVKIVFTGIRPGEKLSEDLMTAAEGTLATRHKQIFTARANPVFPEGSAAWEGFWSRLAAGDADSILVLLQQLVAANRQTFSAEAEAAAARVPARTAPAPNRR